MGCPVYNLGQHVQDIFEACGIDVRPHECTVEFVNPITESLIKSFENAYSQGGYEGTAKAMAEYYFQFLKAIGWTREQFEARAYEFISPEGVIEFYKAHIGENYITKDVIVLLESI